MSDEVFRSTWRSHQLPRSQPTYRVASVVALTGLISLGLGLMSIQAAIAAERLPTPDSISTPVDLLKQAAKDPTSKLPPPLVNTLRQHLSQQTGIAAAKLRVVEANQKNWSNGCLGLAKPDELCTQALVKGWRVVLSNGTRRWIYRTNVEGTSYRLETPAKRSSNLPDSIVRQPVNFEKPSRIPINELPPRLSKDIVLRAIASGGFIGRTYQTTLFKDGRVIRELIGANGSPVSSETYQVSAQRARQFQQLLKQRQLQRFHRLDYPATPGSADFTTVTLSSHVGVVRYADTIQSELPETLQAVIRAWGEITRNG